MNADDQPIETAAVPGAVNNRPSRPVLALALNAFALLWYGFAQIGPLMPSQGFPTPLVFLTSVGVPTALLLIAARLCRSRVARALCYIEAVSILYVASHWYWTLAHMIGEGYVVSGWVISWGGV